MSKPPFKPVTPGGEARPASVEVPQPPKCFKQDCGDWGSHGFLFPGKRQEWACGAHKDEMNEAWTAAVQAKIDADAAALKPKQGSLW